MGGAQSVAYRQISRIIPELHEDGWDEPKWQDKTRAREQFIHSIITLISSNGRTSLEDHTFKLFFSRRDDGLFVATLVALKNDVIVAKIEPPRGGATQTEAFQALRKHVDGSLHDFLDTVPDFGPAAGASTSERGPGDLPPAYERASERENAKN